MAKLGKLETTVTLRNDNIVVTLYNTDILTLDNDGIITLNAVDPNGKNWLSATTARRMNQASEDLEIGFKVFQKNHSWFVSYKAETIPFTAGKVSFHK